MFVQTLKYFSPWFHGGSVPMDHHATYSCNKSGKWNKFYCDWNKFESQPTPNMLLDIFLKNNVFLFWSLYIMSSGHICNIAHASHIPLDYPNQHNAIYQWYFIVDLSRWYRHFQFIYEWTDPICYLCPQLVFDTTEK